MKNSRASARETLSEGSHRSKIKMIALVLLAVVVLGVVWLAFSGVMAAMALNSAKANVGKIQSSIVNAENLEVLADHQVSLAINEVASDTNKANFWTSGPVWWAATSVPYLGNTFQAIRSSTVGADIASTQALPELASAARDLSTKGIRNSSGSFNLNAIEKARVPLARASRSMHDAVAQADQAPVSGVFGPIATATQSANAELHSLQRHVATLETTSVVLPTMLGKDRLQRYFVAFTSPAEARSGGGFLGTYGILQAKNGKIKLEKVGSNSELTDFKKPVLDFGNSYKSTYGKNSALWRNMNLSPHFPYAAQQFIEGWNKLEGQELDGVLSVDVATLAYLSEGRGGISLPDGKNLKTSEIVDYLTNQIYIDFEDDVEGRKQIQVAAAEELLGSLFSGGEDPMALAKPLARAASEGRLLVYSADPKIEARLVDWPISGTVNTEPGPYAYLLVNNYGGNKLEYYLDRELEYVQESCTNGIASSVITTSLTYDIPSGIDLPDYIGDRLDSNADRAGKLSTRTAQMVLLPMASRIKSVSVNGKPRPYAEVREAGRPGVVVVLDFKPRKKVQLQIELEEPGSNRQPQIPVQPLVREQQTVVSWPPCVG